MLNKLHLYMKELKAVEFTRHALERAKERGLLGYLTPFAVSYSVPLGNCRYRTGRCVYIIDLQGERGRVVTVYPARKRHYLPS